MSLRSQLQALKLPYHWGWRPAQADSSMSRSVILEREFRIGTRRMQRLKLVLTIIALLGGLAGAIGVSLRVLHIYSLEWILSLVLSLAMLAQFAAPPLIAGFAWIRLRSGLGEAADRMLHLQWLVVPEAPRPFRFFFANALIRPYIVGTPSLLMWQAMALFLPLFASAMALEVYQNWITLNWDDLVGFIGGFGFLLLLIYIYALLLCWITKWTLIFVTLGVLRQGEESILTLGLQSGGSPAVSDWDALWESDATEPLTLRSLLGALKVTLLLTLYAAVGILGALLRFLLKMLQFVLFFVVVYITYIPLILFMEVSALPNTWELPVFLGLFLGQTALMTWWALRSKTREKISRHPSRRFLWNAVAFWQSEPLRPPEARPERSAPIAPTALTSLAEDATPRPMKLKAICFATTNPHKLDEARSIFAEHLPGIRLLAMDETPAVDVEVEETGETFAANSLLKAREVGNVALVPTLADDSGLEVDCLDGRPGVHSARYAPTNEERIARVLREVKEARPEPGPGREARFVCVASLWFPPRWARPPLIAEGHLEGEIALEPRGEGGFGYDPIFFLPEFGKTVAEIPADEKNRLSHRGQALEELARKVKEAGLAE